MRVVEFEAIAAALNAAGVRYLVVGGLAVNAHGYVRLTQDIEHLQFILREQGGP